MDRWKSPIDLQMFEESFATKILEDQTGCVVETCVKMGVNVDKEELLKALAYDRHQYEQGYSDGIRARDSEIVRCFECKYHYKDGDNVVTSHCLLNHNHVQPSDWYCADGERKETDDGKTN